MSDTIPASTSTTDVVSVGGSVSSEIDSGGDNDWFSINLQSGQNYRIDLEGSPTSAGTLLDPFLRGIHDASGELIFGTTNADGGFSINSSIDFSPSTSGTHYIAAGAFGSDTGTYRLSVTVVGDGDDFGETVSTAGSISIGGRVVGEIESASDRDWFAVSLQAGETYQIDQEGNDTFAGTLPDPFLRGIHNANGELISNTSNDDGSDSLNSAVVFSAPTTGTYYISAGAFDTDTGTYLLSVNNLVSGDDFGETPSIAGSVAVDGSARGVIEQSGDRDWFAVSLQGGQVVRIDLEGDSTSAEIPVDTTLEGVYDASGSLIPGTFDDDGGVFLNSLLEFSVPTTGTYYISAGAFGSDTGVYTVSVTDLLGVGGDDFGETPSIAGSVSVGSSTTGEIESSADRDWFAVDLQAGQTYQIDLEGNPTGAGTLEDTFIRGIFDSGGIQIDGTTNDDGGISVNSQLEFTATSTGTHYISAGAFGGDTGTYTLSVGGLESSDDFGEVPSIAGLVTVGGSVTGTIEESGDRDWFAVSLQGGTTYLFDLEGSPTLAGTLEDTFLRGIHDVSGNLISGTTNDDGGESVNSQLEFTAPTTGTHYISAGAFGSGTGTYRVSVSDLGGSDDFAETVATVGTVSVGGSTSGEIEQSGDRDWLAVSLLAGQSYQIDLEGSPTSAGTLEDTFLGGIHDASGNLISNTSNDDDGIGLNSLLEFTASSTGTHYIAVEAFGSDTGTYRVSVGDLGSGGGSGGSDDFGETVATAGSVGAGISTNADIEEASDRDWFAVNLQAGQSYQVDLEGSSTSAGTLFDTVLRGIYDASGNLLSGTTNDDGGIGLNSLLEFTATSTGAHYISAGAYDSDTGTYRISVSDLGGSGDDFAETVSTAGSVSVGGSTSGEIEQSSDRDWFAVSLQAGQIYQIDLEGSPTSVGTLQDTFLRGIHDSSGNLISDTTNDDGGTGRNSQLEFTASSTGTHYISAGAFGSDTGTYKLTVSGTASVADDFAETVSTAGSVSVGGSTNGEIEAPGDTDWFAVGLQAGQTYQINLEGSPTSVGTLADTFLRGVHDASGNLISDTANDDGGTELNSLLEFTAASTGTHYIAAGSFGSGTGTYKLSVAGPPETVNDDYGASVSTAGSISLGNAKTAEIEASCDRDWFAISLEAGRTYQIDLEGSPTSAGTLSDTVLEGIFDGSGNLIANTTNDDGGTGSNSQVQFTASTTGTHYISAQAFGASTGSYTLNALDTTVSQGSSTFNITINFSGDVQFQSFFETAAQRWAEIIVGDLPEVVTSSGIIDDLVIAASVVFIDGVGSILGQAGFRELRSDSLLPSQGEMFFDTADMANMLEKGILQDVILHEMGHVLGFTNWLFTRQGLSTGTSFTGSNALNAYRALTGNQSLSFVPLEDEGGSGTRLSHWEESIFDTELMTGFSENNPPMPVSSVTIGALQDLGYSVNVAQAESFSVTSGASLMLPSTLQTEAVFALQTENPDVLTLSSQAIEGFTGSTFTFNEDKALVLNAETTIQKLEGNITSADETSVFFFETSTGFNQLVRLDGVFEKNNPTTSQNIKGTVSKISFIGQPSPNPTALEFESPQDVQVIINNWHNNFLAGDNFINVVSLDPSDDIVDTGAGNDVIALGAGNDTLVGGAGIDVAVFQNNIADYVITNSNEGLLVAGPAVDGTDTLTGVERLQFIDKSIAFDLDGDAGNAAKLLGAILGGASVANEEYVGIVLSLLDSGTGFETLMQTALDTVLGPAPSNEAIITLFHTNLIGQVPSAETLVGLVPLLESGDFTPASLGVAAAEHDLNQANIDLIGLTQTGIEYLPMG